MYIQDVNLLLFFCVDFFLKQNKKEEKKEMNENIFKIKYKVIYQKKKEEGLKLSVKN